MPRKKKQIRFKLVNNKNSLNDIENSNNNIKNNISIKRNKNNIRNYSNKIVENKNKYRNLELSQSQIFLEGSGLCDDKKQKYSGFASNLKLSQSQIFLEGSGLCDDKKQKYSGFAKKTGVAPLQKRNVLKKKEPKEAVANEILVKYFPNEETKDESLGRLYIMLFIIMICLFVIAYSFLKELIIDAQGQSSESIVSNMNNVMRKEINQDRFFLVDKKAVFACGVFSAVLTILVIFVFSFPKK